MRRVLRISGIAAAVLFGLLVLGYVGLQVYLNSGSAKRMASDQLSQLLGGNVRVTELSSGVASTSVQIEVAAQPTDGSAAREAPLAAGTVSVDVSPLGLAAGSSPSTVTVEKAQLTLHFNENGDLTDKLPSPKSGGGAGKVPDIRIKGATVHLVQQGKPDFQASGIDVSVTDQGAKVVITGDTTDPKWGKWKLSGEWAADGKAGQVKLASDGKVHLTPDLLRAIPFVPRETWDVVDFDGTTPATVEVGRGADEKWWWKVDAAPEDTLVRVHAIDLNLVGASGRVRVDGPKVILTGVTGKTAGGSVKVNSEMDFTGDRSVLTYDVAVDRVDITKLPKSWHIPPQFTAGKAVGGAKVTVVLKDGKIENIQTPGKGDVKLVDAQLLGFPAETVDFPIYSTGSRIQFGDTAGNDAGSKKTSWRVEGGPWGVPARSPCPLGGEGLGVRGPTFADSRGRDPAGYAPSPHPRPLPPEGGGEEVSSHPVTITDPAVVAAFVAVLLQQPPPAKDAPPQTDDQPTYVGANIKLRDVDIAEFLKRAKVTIPVRLAGKVTFEVHAEIPVAQASSIKAYKATGSLTVPRLEVEGLVLDNLAAHVELLNGVLTLNKLAANVPVPNQPGSEPGSFLGTARFGIDPRTELAADLTVTDLPLGPVFAAVPAFAGKAEGQVSGTFTLRMPGDKLSDVSAITASGKLSSNGLTVFGQRADRLNLELAVKNGVAELTNATVDIYKGTVTGTARVPLAGNERGSVRVGFKDVDAGVLSRSLPDFPIKLDGRFGGKLDAALPPVDAFDAAKLDAKLDLDAPRLIVQGIPTTKLTGKLGLQTGAMLTYALQGEALGGTFDVNGSYPLGTIVEKGGAAPGKAEPPKDKDGKPAGGTVRLNGLRLNQLAGALNVQGLAPLRGVIDAAVNYTFGPDGPTGGGRLTVADLGWGQSVPSDIAAVVSITPQRLETTELVGQLAGGILRGVIQVEFDRPSASHYTLTLTKADAATLLAAAGVKGLEGDLSLAVQGTLTKEMRGRGYISSSSARWSDLRISSVRIPLEWALVPGGGQLAVRDAGGRVANGRVTGSTMIRWGSATRVEGKVDFFDVGVQGLLRQLGSNSTSVAGRATGHVRFSGTRVRTVNDLQGTVTATFGNAQVGSTPVFRALTPYITPLGSVGTFKEGGLTGRIGNGNLFIDRLTLTSPNVRMFIDGAVGFNGRLDLDVLAQTGQIGVSGPLVRLLRLPIPVVGPIPLSVLVQASDFLSNRLIRLHVGGTTRSPLVQLNVANLLTEEALRYFLGSYAPLRSQLYQNPR